MKVYDKIYALADDVVDEMRLIAKNKFDTNKVDLLLNELYPGEDRNVPDPYYGAEPGYHTVYDLIDKACDAIIEKASTNPSKRGALESQRIKKLKDE
mgnify:FL=1